MRRTTSAALLALSVALAACGPTNRGLDSVHQPVVSRNNYTFDVGTASDGLAYGEQARLSGWFESLQLGYGDRIAVDDGSGSPAARDAVAEVAARYGLLVEEQAPVTEGPVEPGKVRVVVSRATAEVPDCPNWKRISQPEFEGSTTSNYGCAVNGNLAAMIANPEDLVRGQTGSGTDARTVSKSITTYRELPNTGREPNREYLKRDSTRSSAQ